MGLWVRMARRLRTASRREHGEQEAETEGSPEEKQPMREPTESFRRRHRVHLSTDLPASATQRNAERWLGD